MEVINATTVPNGSTQMRLKYDHTAWIYHKLAELRANVAKQNKPKERSSVRSAEESLLHRDPGNLTGYSVYTYAERYACTDLSAWGYCEVHLVQPNEIWRETAEHRGHSVVVQPHDHGLIHRGRQWNRTGLSSCDKRRCRTKPGEEQRNCRAANCWIRRTYDRTVWIQQGSVAY